MKTPPTDNLSKGCKSDFVDKCLYLMSPSPFTTTLKCISVLNSQVFAKNYSISYVQLCSSNVYINRIRYSSGSANKRLESLGL